MTKSSLDTFHLYLQEIRRSDSRYRLDVHWWSSILKVKQLIQELTNEPPSRQHIYHSTNPTELSNSIMLHDLGIEKSGHMLWIAIDYRNGTDFSIAPAKDVELDVVSKEMIEAVRFGLQRSKPPTATDEFEGSGGVYFMRNSMGSYIAVFKPHDEEQGMPNNPKDHVGTGIHGLREYFKPGQGCLRELAAYIMDVGHFSSVPITTLVHCEHPTFHYPLHPGIHSKQGKPFPKLGSLQEFVGGAELFEDIGPSLLSDYEVQKIALLDMRILNCDRNAANILAIRKSSPHSLSDSTETFHFDFQDEIVISGSPSESPNGLHGDHHGFYQLIPIDHGYSMPSRLKIVEWDWAWFNYPHISRPVHPDLVEYMKSLDIESLVNRLRFEVNISDDCLFLIRIAHHVLLSGLSAGLTLKDLAVIFVRSGDDEDIPSRLEQAIDEAEENAFRAIELKTNRSKSHSPSSAYGSSDDKSVRSTSSGSTDHDELFSRPPLMAAASCNQIAFSRNHSSSSSLSTFLEEGPKTLPIPTLGSRGKSWCPSVSQLDTITERRERAMSSVSNTSLSDYDSGPSQAGSYDPKSAGIELLIHGSSQDDELRKSENLQHNSPAFSNPSPMNKSQTNIGAVEYEYEAFYAHSSLSGTPLKSLKSIDSNGSYHASGNSGGKIRRSEAIQIPITAAPPPLSMTDNSPISLACFPYGSPYLRQSTSQNLESAAADEDYVMCNLDDIQEDFGTNLNQNSPDENYQDILFDVPIATAIPLSRVVSFSGFESRPLYSNPSIRAMGNLRLERRKVIADSAEFKQLRLDFAQSHINNVIQRIVAHQKALSIR